MLISKKYSFKLFKYFEPYKNKFLIMRIPKKLTLKYILILTLFNTIL